MLFQAHDSDIVVKHITHFGKPCKMYYGKDEKYGYRIYTGSYVHFSKPFDNIDDCVKDRCDLLNLM